jgi:hypothetical protein
MFRLASMRDEIEVEGQSKQALKGLFALAAMALAKV